ncbi:MAG: G5 domain-containing protein [Armatimonadetes bacterium]|nr:G5 domain-containing protein [Armatimonadota bacterium]
MQRRKSRRAITALCVVATLAANIAVVANRTDVAQAQASAKNVTITVDGKNHQLRTTQTTVGATLKEAGIEIGPEDLLYPKSNVRTYNGMKIRIVRVVERVIAQEEPIAFTTRRKPTTELRLGLSKVISEGKRGLKRLYYQVRIEDGTVKKRELLRAEVISEPEDREILIGERGAGIGRGSFVSRRILSMNASAYDPGPRSCGKYANGRTCTGMEAGYGVVAVDPSVIPLGSSLYIEGYGYAIAGDKGRSIKGNKIDLGFDTYAAARRFGRRQVVVHILE